MQMSGFIAPPKEHWRYCPYCGSALGKIKEIERRTQRIVICKSCKRTIDERYIRW